MRRRRLVSGLAACCLVLATLAGCSSGPTIGQVVSDGTRVQLTVPAMWAFDGKDAKPVGGIEPAGISIDRAGEPGFTVDLATIDAQGAGAMWEAATASAAVVATLYSGVDPGTISMDFTITGPIDGPSAGGILTVGLLAALRGQNLLEGVTMTGTITPDGSIGGVGLVKTKIEKAAEAGYTTILIPPSTRMFVDPATGKELDLVVYGQGLGVEVVPVGTVAEAYERFTGAPFLTGSATPYAMPPPVRAAGTAIAGQLLETLRRQRSEVTLGENGAALVDDYLARMQERLDAGQPAAAYGIGAFFALELARLEGEQAIQPTLADRPLAQVRDQERQRIQRLRDAADVALQASVRKQGRNLSQQLSLPAAAAWATFAIAGFDSLLANLDQVGTEEAMLELARLASEYQCMAEVFFPQAMQVVDAMPGEPLADDGPTATFLSQYRNFLIAAGKANEAYAQDVLKLNVDEQGQAAIGGLAPIAVQLHETAVSIDPAQGDAPRELLESAYALTYYIVTATMTANAQAYKVQPDGPAGAAAEAKRPEVLRTSVGTGQQIVDTAASVVAASGLDAGYPAWSTSWGVAGLSEYRGSPIETSAAWIALNEVWYDAVNVFMLNAAEQAGLASPAS